MIRITDDETTRAYRDWIIAMIQQKGSDLANGVAQFLRLIDIDGELFLDVAIEDPAERYQWMEAVANMKTVVAFLAEHHLPEGFNR